jgi:exopolysaccharide production protein ExoZ
MAPASAHPPIIRSVQYLRAIAALSVMMFHASLKAGCSFPAGPAGVDVFFVISGFIIASILEARPISPGKFLAGRLIRIVPAYWTVTLTMLAVSKIAPRLFPNMQPTESHVVYSLLFVPHIHPQGQVFPLLAAGWTLNYEMFFYLLFAACLLLPRRIRFPALIGVLVTLVLAGRVVEIESPVLRCFTSPLLLEFAAGVCVAEAARRRALVSWRIGAVAMVAGGAAFVIQHFLPGASSDLRLLMWGLPATLLVGGAISFEHQLHVPLIPFGMQLGAASYAIYLVHGLTISAVSRLAHMLPVPLFLASCAIASIAAGFAFFTLFERPVTRLLQQAAFGRGAPRISPSIVTS